MLYIDDYHDLELHKPDIKRIVWLTISSQKSSTEVYDAAFDALEDAGYVISDSMFAEVEGIVDQVLDEPSWILSLSEKG